MDKFLVSPILSTGEQQEIFPKYMLHFISSYLVVITVDIFKISYVKHYFVNATDKSIVSTITKQGIYCG